MSTSKTQFTYYEANSFRGIDSSAKVFIDMTALIGKKKSGAGFVKMSGDSGLGKTSRLTGIAYGMGASLGIEKAKLINRIDNKIDEALGAIKDGYEYRVEIGTDRIVVRRKGEDGKMTVVKDSSPTEMVKDIFGTVMMIPFGLGQKKKGKDQIQYFLETFGGESDIAKKIDNVEAMIDKLFDERRDAKREMDALKNALDIEPMYQNYESSADRFSKPISTEKEKKKYEEAKEKHDAFNKYSAALEDLRRMSSGLSGEIAELERQLAAKRAEKQEADRRIVDGEKWVKENEGILKEFKAIEDGWISLAKTLADQEKWKDILKKERQYNEKAEQWTELDAQIEEKREALKKLAKKCLPIEELSIQFASGIDKKQQESVMYLVPGKEVSQPIHELSESEEAEMWIKILEALEVQFAFIENMSSFGSNTVDALNAFVGSGGTVFYTEMDRSKDECEVSFHTKLS